jgi:hypothetical protein
MNEMRENYQDVFFDSVHDMINHYHTNGNAAYLTKIGRINTCKELYASMRRKAPGVKMLSTL